MNKLISKFLCAIALSISAVSIAPAATVQSSDLKMRFDDDLFSSVSQQGDSFTLSFLRGSIWAPDGDIVLAIDRYAFDFSAQPGYALTGKMSVQLDATYRLDASVDASAQMWLGFDVILPFCDACGPYDGALLNSANGSASSTSENTGSLSINTGNTPANGNYDRLIMYVVNDFMLTRGDGQINFNSITFTAETVPVSAVPISAVPELPPFVMLAIGLAFLGASVHFKRRKKARGT